MAGAGKDDEQDKGMAGVQADAGSAAGDAAGDGAGDRAQAVTGMSDDAGATGDEARLAGERLAGDERAEESRVGAQWIQGGSAGVEQEKPVAAVGNRAEVAAEWVEAERAEIERAEIERAEIEQVGAWSEDAGQGEGTGVDATGTAKTLPTKTASTKTGGTKIGKARTGGASAGKAAGGKATGGRKGVSGEGGKQGGELVLQRGRAGAAQRVIVQRRRPKRNGWTIKRRAQFLEVLQASCNVSEAARSIGLTPLSVYKVRRRDPVFAAQWAEALEQGYAELEMLLLRQSIHGSETTETLEDGGGAGARRTRKVHSFPHAIGLRLLLAHRETVDSFRQERGIDRPGSEEVQSEIRRRMAAMRKPDDAPGREDDGDDEA